MAGSMNVDGLVSGLDTTSLINQLMQLERQPQVRLTNTKAANNRLADLYRQLNTKLDAVEKASEALNLSAGWRTAKVTTSDAARVTATVDPSADTGSLTFRVLSLASARTVVSDGTVAGDAVFTGGFTVNGIQIDEVGTGSLSDVAAAITASEAGVKATVIKVGTDQFRLQLASKVTGSGSTIDVSGLDNGLLGFGTVIDAGSSAQIQVGTPPNSYTVTSDSNTITDVMPGVTLSLVKADPDTDVTVSVGNDRTAVADKVATMVNAVNDALALIKANSGYDEKTKAAGLLLGNQITSQLSTDLARAVTDPVSGATIMGEDLGIKVDRYGVATFDRAKFLAAYDDDPDAVEAFFTAGTAATTDDGLAERLRSFTFSATSLTTGPFNLALTELDNTNRRIDQQISDWDYRLSIREDALKRQFSAMEVALGQAKNMSSWLSGQIASLPTSSSL